MSQTSAVVPKIAPPAANALTVTTAASAWGNGNYIEFLASTSAAAVILGLNCSAGSVSTQYEVDIATGAASSEVVIGTLKWHVSSSAAGEGVGTYLFQIAIGGVGNGDRLAIRIRSNTLSADTLNLALIYAEGWDADSETPQNYMAIALPAAADSPDITPNASAWANSNYGEITSGYSKSIGLAALVYLQGVANVEFEMDVATGAGGAETVISTLRGAWLDASTSGGQPGYIAFPAVYKVAKNTRIAVRMRKSGTSVTTWPIGLNAYELPGASGGAGKGNKGNKGNPGVIIQTVGGPNILAYGNPSLDVGSL